MSYESAETPLGAEQAGDTLRRSLAQLASIRFGDASVEEVLGLIVSLARETVSGVDGASLTMRRQGLLETPQYTHEALLALDQAQYEAGDGPCLEALDGGAVVHGTDGLDRWPALAARAGSMGIRSVLSEPLESGAEVLASLNLYSRAASFDDEAKEASALFAAPAATAFANATAYAAAAKLNENLREAIATREIIGEAKGILMARQGCTSDEAFDILRRASQRTNRKLRFDEKVRYKWRRRKSVVRFVLLKISRYQPQPKPQPEPGAAGQAQAPQQPP